MTKELNAIFSRALAKAFGNGLIETIEDPVEAYVRLKYPDTVVCALYRIDDYPDYFGLFCKENPLNLETLIPDCRYIIAEFSDINAAIEFCNSISDSQPFSVVFDHGVAIHENT